MYICADALFEHHHQKEVHQSITTLFMHPVIYIKHKSTHIINHNRQIIKILYSKSIPLPYLLQIQTYIQRYSAKQQRILCSLVYINNLITFAIQYLKKGSMESNIKNISWSKHQYLFYTCSTIIQNTVMLSSKSTFQHTRICSIHEQTVVNNHAIVNIKR